MGGRSSDSIAVYLLIPINFGLECLICLGDLSGGLRSDRLRDFDLRAT